MEISVSVSKPLKPYSENKALQEAQKKYRKKMYDNSQEYRDYHRQKERQWFANNKEKMRAYMKEYNKNYRLQKKLQTVC